MSKMGLRIFDESAASEPASPEPTVRMTLRELFPILVHAHRFNHQWLKDLGDDEIVVTHDLADIAHAFDTMLNSRKSA